MMPRPLVRRGATELYGCERTTWNGGAVSREPTAEATAPLPAIGARVGAYRVVRTRGDDAVLAREDGGREALLVFGERNAMQLEARTLRELTSVVPVSRVLDAGEHPEHGAWIALEAQKSASVGVATLEGLDLRTVRAMAALLDLLAALERQRLSFAPKAEDVEIAPEGLRVLRLRALSPLGPHDRLDARAALQAVSGRIFDDRLAPEILRLLLPSKARRETTIDAVRAELKAAIVAVGAPDDERVAALTDAGLARDQNEDAVATFTLEDPAGGEAIVAIVCDGVSSAQLAAQASRLAVDSLREVLTSEGVGDPAHALSCGITQAHDALCDIQRLRGGIVVGTTVVAAVVRGRRATIAWVGDSRAYALSHGAGAQLTRDHSWLVDAVENGNATLEEALRSPYAHALTRCLGPLEGGDPEHARPDILEIDLTPGFLVLCTDGLWNYAADTTALAKVAASAREQNPTAVARALMSHALLSGAHDNVSVAVIAIP